MSTSSFPKIDAHTHLFYAREFVGPMLEAWDLHVVVINISDDAFFREAREARWQAMRALKQAHPDRVALCTAFDARDVVERPDGVDQVLRRLRRRIEEGAAAVKVWKDLGLIVRDADGHYVQIDDSRFEPVWDYLADEGIPIIAHIAEPRAAWLPLDEASPHYRFYRDNPHHHLFGRSDVPSWEALIEARDRWIEQNPSLTIIGAHLGSMAYDIGEVVYRLDKYPNFSVDTAERFGDLVTQPSEMVRQFFVQHADRILYGTDVILDVPPERGLDECQAERSYKSLLDTHAQYLGGKGDIEIQDKLVRPVRVEALNLPPDVRRKVYYENARRIFF